MHPDLPTLNLSPLEPYGRVRGSRTARVLTLPALNPHTHTPVPPPNPLTSGTPVDPASDPAPGRGAHAGQDWPGPG